MAVARCATAEAPSTPVAGHWEEFMRKAFSITAGTALLAVVCLIGAAGAQAPAGQAAPSGQTAPAGPVGVGPGSAAAPTYTSIILETTINKPAAEVWKRVGKFCDIAEWLRIAGGCTITAGKDGEVGAVRSVAGEVMVAKTEFSYTYTQTPAFQAPQARNGRPYNLYHGTVEARPASPTTTRLIYTLFFDNSMLADDAAREMDRANKTRQFQGAVDNMKILAEGGTLPPVPARGAAPAAPPAGTGRQ
jgi:hypothetical protein